MNGGGASDAVTVLAGIWRDVLGVDEVEPDDDFYSLGGDSLLAIRIVAEAKASGIPLTLLRLFRSPTPRGACAGLDASTAEPDQTERFDYPLPADAVAAYPATSMQLGLIYQSLATCGALYVDVVSRVVRLPLDVDTLRRALDRVAGRHPALRTRFDLAHPEPMQVVLRTAPIPLLADPAGLDAPYDPETAPLLRVHAERDGPDSFRLSYSFHHAVLDGWSESVFLRELVTTYAALGRGDTITLPEPAPFVEYVRLERAMLRDAGARRFFVDLVRDMPVTPRSTPDRKNLRKACGTVPPADVDAIVRRCAEWGVPMKSLLLAGAQRIVAARWATRDPVIGLAVSGRPELTGADHTLGLFLNHLPIRLGGATTDWRSAATGALRAENELLPYRWFPYAEIQRLAGGAPFEVSLNYMRFHARDELLDAGLVTAAEDMRDFTDLPARLEAFHDPRGLGLRIDVTVDMARYGADLAGLLVDELLAVLHAVATEPEGDR